jgi:hypothetical protein
MKIAKKYFGIIATIAVLMSCNGSGASSETVKDSVAK